MPKLTCITTTFNDGRTALTAIESVLLQSFGDFQYLIVDDGSSDDTVQVLAGLTDPRIQVIRQANDGLSSARNKAFAHIKGDYVCFLDSDDVRPNWSFATLAAVIDRDRPDVILCRGNLSEVRGDFSAFYDDGLFFQLEGNCPEGHVKRSDPNFMPLRPLMQRIEPQSANKAIRTDFLRKSGVKFPNGHFFEDIFFHTGVLSEANSVSFVNTPCFTYFRRYLRQQITSTAGDRRFDAVAVSKLTLERFSRTLEFHDAATRLSVMASCMRILSWCGESISHPHRNAFRQTVRAMLASVDPLYLNFPTKLSGDAGPLDHMQSYMRGILDAA
ncbi:MAG: glycosyltransferase family 2 protein [Candidatus Saccharibacteria bacterium]|nr:glycosyltransferase family 2 protein [Pseudorhodobacter sp.]